MITALYRKHPHYNIVTHEVAMKVLDNLKLSNHTMRQSDMLTAVADYIENHIIIKVRRTGV